VLRREPLRTESAKILPLHLQRSGTLDRLSSAG
jgi:hypothetical protein